MMRQLALIGAVVCAVCALASGSAQAACPAGTVQVGERNDPPVNGVVVVHPVCRRISVPEPPPPDARTYTPSGNGLIGGIGWRLGYYSPVGASDEVRQRAMQMVREQSQLAGKPYSESIDFARYNFAIGIAKSTTEWSDFLRRGIFDQTRNGQLNEGEQEAYRMLRGRQFGELGCHSNGAMVCLMALQSRDVRADNVVLYGPQITADSLRLWNELLREGRIHSLQIYINENDPIPPLALLFNTAPTARVVWRARPIFYDVGALQTTISEMSPRAEVHTFACGSEPSIDNCHGMNVYTANRGCLRERPTPAPVPGTSIQGRGPSLEPPSPICPH